MTQRRSTTQPVTVPESLALPWVPPVLPEIPVAGQVAIAGTAGWYIGRGIGHIPIGNGDTVDDAVTNGFANILIYFAKGGKQNISNEHARPSEESVW